MPRGLSLKAVEEQVKLMDVEAALEHLAAMEAEHGISLDKLIQKYTKRKAVLDKELARFEAMCRFEKAARMKGYTLIAGMDEAGRGPLAGPVVAAAVILPENVFISGLNDSKKLSAAKRDALFDEILEKAVDFGIGIADHQCIDEINILQATKQAMTVAISQLSTQPELLLIDAVKLENVHIPQEAYIQGDANSISIAAASIIAKVTRDRLIDEMDGLYPQYGFAKHKGYGTAEHIEAIRKYGPCPIHRNTFIKNFTV